SGVSSPILSLKASSISELKPAAVWRGGSFKARWTPKIENEHVKALILHQLPIPRGIAHDHDGLGTVIPLIVSQVEHSQICIGGSHVLAHALWRSYFANGGMALGYSHVNKIIIENGQAKGVEVSGGEQYQANKLVASAIDLKQTFLELIDERHLESDFLKKIRSYILDEFSIFGVHLALNEPPRHTAAGFNSDIDEAFKLNIGLETPEGTPGLGSDQK
ncbi:MAG: hypothetical protein P8X80_21500, partial [Desulfobacterales bacterium]